MQLIKDKKKLTELQKVLKNSDRLADSILDVLSFFEIKQIVEYVDCIKRNGIRAISILFTLILLPFYHNFSVRALHLSRVQEVKGGKDAFYDFKNNFSIDWRKLLYLFAKRYRKILNKRENLKGKGISCLIADDTDLEKTGYQIEFIGKIWSHVFGRSVLGFKMLLLSYWDGCNMIPLDFSLHREVGRQKAKPYGLTSKQLKKRKHHQRDTNSPSAKRIKELDKKKTTVLIEFIKRALKHGFAADYFLCDSWFMNWNLVNTIHSLKSKMHLLGMAKMNKTKYKTDSGKFYTAKELLHRKKKSSKRSRKINAEYIEIVVDFKGITVKLFFIKLRKTKTWRMILSTDLRIKFTKAIEIYQLRWGIEVLFKEAKQHLHLSKCQSTNFDAQIADTTITLIQYMILSFFKRLTNQSETQGIFNDTFQNQVEINLADKLWGLFIEIQKEIANVLQVDLFEVFKELINNEQYQFAILKMTNLLDNEDKHKMAA